jgi:hypothetical protein
MTRLRELARLLGLIGLVALFGPVAAAQGQAPFTPSTTPESISGGTLLLVAYGLAWALVLLYVFMIWRKSRRIEQELADVTAKLNARPKR